MTVRLILRRDQRRLTKHRPLWIEARAIAKTLGPPDPGALARLCDPRGETVAIGTYAPDAKIRMRVLVWGDELEPDWLTRRIAGARARRRALGFPRAREPGARSPGATDGFREINSEGDGLPGLTVDRYGEHRVVVLGSAAMVARRGELEAALAEGANADEPRSAATIWLRPQGLAEREGFAPGFEGPRLDRLAYWEHGLRIEAPAPPTQKTGAYHDQRENRARVAASAEADGRPLLDLGCHVGGFSLHAAARGVDALAVDSSARMLAFVRANAERLRTGSGSASASASTGPAGSGEHSRAGVRAGRVQTLRADLFAPFDAAAFAGGFGTVVLDPPKLVRHPREVARARRATTRLCENALAQLGEGGLLVSCSCSHHFGREELDACAEAAAASVGRTITLEASWGAGPDHPVPPGHARGEYLRVQAYRLDRPA